MMSSARADFIEVGKARRMAQAVLVLDCIAVLLAFVTSFELSAIFVLALVLAGVALGSAVWLVGFWRLASKHTKSYLLLMLASLVGSVTFLIVIGWLLMVIASAGASLFRML